ncbi:MAG TPA: hypothetical protein VGC27_07620, partial [Rhizomicrobium sp.]
MTGAAHMMFSFRKIGALLILAGVASWAQSVESKAVESKAENSPARTDASKVINFGDVAVSLAWSSTWQLESASPKGMPGTVEFHAPDRLQMVTMLTPIGGTPSLSADAAMKELV